MCVIQGRIPDRVPVALHNFLMASRLAGHRLSECMRSGKLLAESQLKAWELFKHDVIMMENGVAASAEAFGCAVDYSDERAPTVLKGVMETLEDATKLKLPDPWDTFPLSELLKATRILRKELGDEVFILGRADQGPLSLSAILRGISGYEEIMVDIALNEKRELVEHLLDLACEHCVRFVVAQIEAGAHATSLGDTGPEISSPDICNTYIFPRVARVADAVHKAGGVLSLHMCGNSTPVVEGMIKTGADILELDHHVDLRLTKKITQGRATVLGLIDPAGLMLNRSFDEIKESCRQTIEIMAPHGGFLIGPGCALPYQTPIDSVKAIIESAKIYGEYSSEGSLKNVNEKGK